VSTTTWTHPPDHVRRRWTLPALAQRPAGRRLAMTDPRWVVPALVVVAVALVAAADRLASSGPLGFAATAALLLGAPALVAGLSRRAFGSRP
jgi:hypothetical protein